MSIQIRGESGLTPRDGERTSLLRASESVPVRPPQDFTGDTHHVHLTFRDVGYEVKLPKTKEVKKILNGVSGSVHGGQLVAIIGPSGAGKTTMLDILAQRQKGGTVTGEIMMNGRPVDQGVFRRVSAYVQQEDILHGYLTVKETIGYSAKLRLPPSVSDAEIADRTSYVMKMLGIDHVKDRKIGNEVTRGVSGGEKKRTAIAVELVTNPSLLFLDEPTTGLDTFTALHLGYILKKLASQGTTIIMSIHQPRSSIFRLFDSVLVLNGFGEEAYFGPAGDAVDFLTSVGVPQTYPDNPADFLLDSVSVVRAAEDLKKEDFPFLPPPTQSQDIAAAFRSMKLDKINEHIDSVQRLFSKGTGLPPALSSPYHRSVFQQIRVVSERAVINKVRDPIATAVAIITAIFFATLIGSIYYKITNVAPAGIQDRLGVLFFLTMNTAFSNLGSLALFLFDRSIYVREHRNGMYRPSAYYIGKILQDVPLGIFVNLMFDAIAYYMVGLQPSAEKFAWFFLINTLVMLNSYSLCLLVSSASKNYQVANIVAPLILVLYLLPSGFLINLDDIPIIWRWIKYISFFRYGFEGVVLNEFEGLYLHCNNTATVTVNGTVEPCMISGIDYVEHQLGFKQTDFTFCIAMCGGTAAFYALVGYIFLRLFRSSEGK